MAATNVQSFSGDIEVASNINASNITTTQKLTIDGTFRVSDASGFVDINSTPGTQWGEIANLTAGDATAGDSFGEGVEIDGDTMVVGATFDADKGSGSGSAYIFTRDTPGDIHSNWTQRAKLLASDGEVDDNFGQSVAIDGDTVVIGSYGEDAPGENASGAAYIFTRNTPGSLTSGWTQVAKLRASDFYRGDYFGVDVSVHGDTVVIGSYQPSFSTSTGAAYIFTPSGPSNTNGGWAQVAKLSVANTKRFGWSVSVDGDMVAVGAYLEYGPGSFLEGANMGAAYIFTRDTPGSLTSGWTQVAKLIAGDRVVDDKFGYSVSIQGNTAVIGKATNAFGNDNNSTISSAYIFTPSGPSNTNGGWVQVAKLTASDGALYDNFGVSVSIDGDTVAIGAQFNDDPTNSGSVYIFTRNTPGSLTSGWTEQTKLTASDAAADAIFGQRVSIDESFKVVAIGSPGINSVTGSVYVFENLPLLVVKGDITSGLGGNILSFTGQHMCFPEGLIERGLVVSANKNKFMNLNGILSTGLSAIKSSESLPIVSLSNVVNDPTVFGVVDSVESASSMRTQRFGGTIVENKKESGDNRVIVNSLGEGAMWVVNTNGNISSGDYITTSNINGYGHKQDDDILHSYTVAKITMDCDFNPQELPIQVIKKDNNGTNVLDNYGRLQWKDTDNTQKAYKIKYLKVDGKETDQANAVCTAAYVGCTYHCG